MSLAIATKGKIVSLESVSGWTSAEKEQIRSALGLDGNKVEAAGGQLQDMQTDTSFMLKIIKNKKVLQKTGVVWSLHIFDDDETTPILSKEIKDKNGNDITDIEAGCLAQELTSSV